MKHSTLSLSFRLATHTTKWPKKHTEAVKQSPTSGKSTFLTFKSPLKVILLSSLTRIFTIQHTFLAPERQILLLRLPEDWRLLRRPPPLIRQ